MAACSASEVYEHAYPHCWRCGTPLLYYAKSSWYIRTTDVRDRMLEENEKIGWRPDHVKHGRFGKWLEGNVDWALSRERYWGTPLPVWECEAADCDGIFCAGSVAELRERAGDVPDDLHRPYIDEVVVPCEKCGGEMRRVEEVIDAWFDSGAMPYAQFHYPFENEDEFKERFPADYICEGQDQTRGWFYSLLAESTLLFDESSYRNCVCLGLISDPEGQKMSKSRGNVVDPWEVFDTQGADAFRWYLLSTQQPWAGFRFSVETIGEALRQVLLTLWNTYSFFVLYANADDLEIEAIGEAGASDDDLDRWILSQAPGAHGDRDRAHGRLRLHDRGPRDRDLRGRALQLVRAAQPPSLLGRRRRRVRDAAPLPAHARQAAWRRSPRSSPTRSTTTSRAAATRSISPTSPSPTQRSPTASWRRESRRRCARSSSAAPPAQTPRSRTASRCAGR